MTAAVAITREDHTAEDLRREAARCRDADAARRMLALALIKEGGSRTEAARSCGMDRQTLRDWVHRYNAEGLAGLRNRCGGGPKRRLTEAQEARVVELVRQGPHPETHGVIRWRRIDLVRVIEAEFNVTLAERTVGALLHRLGFRRVSVRPRHPEQDPTVQEAHKKTLPIWLPLSCRRERATSHSSYGGRTRLGLVSRAR